MARVTYKIFGERLGAQFSFDLAISSECSDRGRWRISAAKGLGPLGPALAPGGKWQYRKRSGDVHGPFCSVDSGTGTIAASVQEDIKIEWELVGPGCV